ncbi:MAG: cytochrome c [Planctomycetota bacterium]|nr:cytochrome c [Planctomycetota bacterium]
MASLKTSPRLIAVFTFGGVLLTMALYGCKSDQNAGGVQGVAPATQPSTFALFGPPPEKSGVQLWSDNCMRCHNSRPPEAFSAAQWEVIVHHMRLRANLTGDEQRKITQFLQASN